MQRGLAPLALAVLLAAAGCSASGTADSASQVTPSAPRPAQSRFVAACAAPVSSAAAAPSSSAVPSAVPSASASLDPEEQFRLNDQANNAFRQRRALPPQYMAALQPCVEQVKAGLARLRAEGRFDGPSIEGVLTGAGLAEVESHKPGRLDANAGGGLLFCGNSGLGYVFGEHGPPRTTVDAGGGIADGGCLPAPD
ncbi:hypothetical protein [Dactylosporangium sp. NPDC006015]|uniref:hypothetical protein n=1 Tax=Dactylosporangium sp. NPDC006015 TaxID=3154576 RepID=UPI00339E2970